MSPGTMQWDNRCNGTAYPVFATLQAVKDKRKRPVIEQIAKILRHSIWLMEREIYGETDAEDLPEGVKSVWPSNASLPSLKSSPIRGVH